MTRKIAALLAAVTLLGASPSWAEEVFEETASNHGFATAALEVYCKGMLTVVDSKLRARLDRLYRDPKSRWRKDFLRGYEHVINLYDDPTSKWMTCTTAAEDKWLRLDPAARDILIINEKNAEKEKRLKACERWPNIYPECRGENR